MQPHIPFAPADGLAYKGTEEEDEHIYAMQPLKDSEFNPILRHPSTDVMYRPPMFRYAWIIDDDHLKRTMSEKFPKFITLVDRPSQDKPTLPPEYYNYFEFSENPSPKTKIGSFTLTLQDGGLIEGLVESTKLPSDYVDHLEYVLLVDKNGSAIQGMQIGSNYQDVIPPEYALKLRELLEVGDEDPMWYIDITQRYWRRIRSLPGLPNKKIVYPSD
ncbi:uncharacterized protein BXZ73DRAFT_104102 [Epithele typhae]|uniref:uncharacterized protein n=1 Tax=Epithele typhae TaxID=378194 RepID=UPI0020082224|nr:uncharacterized protein BXZ73DRAFT_81114 [Epithele typhae]XP_047874991.1 uncharacterized protein BXZ73DRAFT_104102 [Epithele typhae]KAH9916244.1 hypothetical protein BXZ73DRAFT_81114 [Epithele typhae]KAH9922283.1 hypothetical protein BXZ73DRAFT_104102 [Epithele typhae]